MADVHHWDDASATHNEKALFEILAEVEHKLLKLKLEREQLDDVVVMLRSDIRETEKQFAAFTAAVNETLVDSGKRRTALDGRVDALSSSISEVAEAVTNSDAMIVKLTETLGASDHNFTFLRKLSEFFGPMLENKNPPLDGNQVSTKDYVDKAVERIAGSIRTQVAQAIEMTNKIYSKIGPLVARQTADDITTALAAVLRREQAREAAEEAAKNQPGRLAAMVYALTGKTPR